MGLGNGTVALPRHLIQLYERYNPEQGDTEVLGLWVSYLKESWIEGRLRLQRDATEEAWLAWTCKAKPVKATAVVLNLQGFSSEWPQLQQRQRRQQFIPPCVFGSPWQAWQLFVRCTLQEWRQILEFEDNNEVKELNLRKLDMAVPGICAHPDFCGRVGSGQGF